MMDKIIEQYHGHAKGAKHVSDNTEKNCVAEDMHCSGIPVRLVAKEGNLRKKTLA